VIEKLSRISEITTIYYSGRTNLEFRLMKSHTGVFINKVFIEDEEHGVATYGIYLNGCNTSLNLYQYCILGLEHSSIDFYDL
jgi:hypothetical protein